MSTERLHAVLRGFDRLAVAVSGGVDSMTLAYHAHAVLPGRMTAFHAVSAAVPDEATARVEAHARRHGWELRLIDAGELADPRYAVNPVDRCFYCKTDLYGTIRRHTEGPIASGANLDDLGDWRPGLKAAADHGVRHPLIEAGIDKAAVRRLAAEARLFDLAELPASPCLSSRIETGIPVTVGGLAAVAAAERLLAGRLPATPTLRCRLRRDGLEVQVDPETLAGLDDRARAALSADLAAICREHELAPSVRFAPYVRGSAFLHAR